MKTWVFTLLAAGATVALAAGFTTGLVIMAIKEGQ